MARRDLADRVVELVGSGAIQIIDRGDGWPSICDVVTPTKTIRVALHLSQIGSHSRAAYERRFQNPGDRSPVTAPGGAVPVLVGVQSDRQELVVLEGTSRIGRETRFSILFHDRSLAEAAAFGWAEYDSTSNETIIALKAALLPAWIEQLQIGVFVAPTSMKDAAFASGLMSEDSVSSAERARRAASVLARDARFSRDVRDAYGHACAMCGIGLQLVVGAHIYPVEAPECPDAIWNGAALCMNHHGAFDRHRIWVSPDDLSIRVDPTYWEAAENDPSKAFLENTYEVLRPPTATENRPKSEMFARRYKFYGDRYSWTLS